MTLEDAIKHCEEKAKELRKEADYYRKPSLTFDQEGKEKECLECAREHEQLAEWLKELKALKENEPMTLEKAIDYLHSIGWLQEHDRILTEPKKGKWTEHEDYNFDPYYTCSVCGEDWATIEGTPLDNMMNYCPNCGADMRGTDNGD